MLLRKLVVVGLVGFISFAASIATAEDADAPDRVYAVDGVNFSDPADGRINFNIGRNPISRFSGFGFSGQKSTEDPAFHRYELEFVARGAAGFDLAFAQRGRVGYNNTGDVESESRASELRLGRGLRNMPRDEPTTAPRWYLFAASEDEALVWRPGARSEFGGAGAGLALQDRVEIGDLQAGVTYEAGGLQASLAYVEREVDMRAGSRNFHQDENFAGVTVTMRH